MAPRDGRDVARDGAAARRRNRDAALVRARARRFGKVIHEYHGERNSMAALTLKNVRKSYDGKQFVLHGINVDIADGEFVVLVGPSGCGKSTLLRMVAGLEQITGGTIAIGGRAVNDLPPKERDTAMVFQNYALYPH